MARLRPLSAFAAGIALTAVVATFDAVHSATWIVIALGGTVFALAALRWAGGSGAAGSIRAERDLGWRQFHREVIRSRRGAHPLALVRIPHVGDEPAAVLAALARVRSGLRRADVAWVDEHDVYAMLPETSRKAAVPAVDRLGSLGYVTDSIRLAVFPDDGLTTGALIAAVDGVAPTTIDVRGPITDQLVTRSEPIVEDGASELVSTRGGTA